ncbi:MAG: leucine-rich repeat domain-containing protein [Coriobacteriales bacterium]
MQRFDYKLIEDGTYSIVGYHGDEPEVEIPAGPYIVTVLYDKLFMGHSEIMSIKIPDTVKDIGEFAFDGCGNLRSIVLPDSLEYLWGHTFARSGLEEVVIPDGVRSIPSFAFKDCKSLRRVVCGSGIKNIYAWAFGGCENLVEVVHGPDVKVSPEAFDVKEVAPWRRER